MGCSCGKRNLLQQEVRLMGNPFVHVELMSTDVGKAKDFYGKLFDWKLEDMPMPDMTYEEKETTLRPGDTVLLHSDGLVEAHDPERKMFGFPRLAELMEGCAGGPELIQLLLGELDGFTGPGWEQEDDITLVALQRAAVPAVTEASKTPALVS